MKKIIKEAKNGIVQITVADERWYVRDGRFVPSVTWIAGHYPKGVAFYKWLADKGWDEAESIKQAAGDKGSKVHAAIEDLIKGKKVAMDAKYLNKSTGEMEELTLEEYDCLMSFVNWVKEVKPKFVHSEVVVFNEKEGYAGTIDCAAEIDGNLYIIDFKTGQTVWPEYELQLAAYGAAYEKPADLAVLQLGYKRNKAGWKFTEISGAQGYDLFLAAKKIWAREQEGVEPKKKDYPETLCLQ